MKEKLIIFHSLGQSGHIVNKFSMYLIHTSFLIYIDKGPVTTLVLINYFNLELAIYQVSAVRKYVVLIRGSLYSVWAGQKA